MAKNFDRLQYLPDHILVHIVSFLPFKDAIRTSVLSKKWQYIWRYTRSIEFDENHFTANEARRVLFDSGMQNLAVGIRNSGKKYLVGFAKRWIDSYPWKKIDYLRICYSNPVFQQSDVEDWIKFAISNNVEGLDIDFFDADIPVNHPMNYIHCFDLPIFNFGNIMLRSLNLTACNIDPSEFAKFRSLRSLSIARVNFSQLSFETLISNCMSLEILSLKMCNGIDHLGISSSDLSLMSLAIEDCKPLDEGVMISAPTLRSFKYIGSVEAFVVEDLPLLVYVELDFGQEEYFEDLGDVLADLLDDLNNVEVLTVCSYMTQVIQRRGEPQFLPTPLSELRHLILRIGFHINELPGVSLLLRSCPNLDTLSIDMGPTKILQDYVYPYEPIVDGREFWDLQILPIDCVETKLEKVKINGFKGTKNEVQFLRYLLIKGKAMCRMEIVTSKEAPAHGEDAESYEVIAHKVLQFERASPVVHISIG